ncbi:MAG: exo-alpha-sialidase [Planctomycetaceae bacterium]|nr:exo-alpha-sialidase [Planctomycetales bacterium]MCB9925238.1 exo-alpha-sialidase [Planctomycetaceae bacterium]
MNSKNWLYALIPRLRLATMVCPLIVATTQAADPNWGQPAGEHRIHPKAVFMEGLPLGPFANLPNGDLVTVEDADNAKHAMVSSDDGKTWEKFPVFAEPDRFRISYERALTCTREGTVIVSFMNLVERAGWDWQADIHDSPDAKLPNYVVRSTDGGRTWERPQKMHDDWTGAIRDMIQLRDGSVVFTSQMMLHQPGRHAVVTYASADQGATWKRSNIIDLGGIGHHDGAIEASFVQRRDESLWMLMRTNWGRLWQADSLDMGHTWRPIGPTSLDASAAPPILERLASGRILLAWNRYFWNGSEDFPAAGGDQQWSGTRTSNNRQELSIAFSDDDGASWSEPVVIATVNPTEDGKYPRKEISYPYVFERRPGEIWLTAWRFGGFRVKLFEKDFVPN